MDVYQQSVLLREHKDTFIQAKFNKLMRDRIYGPLTDLKWKVRSDKNQQMVDKLKK